MNRVGPVRCGRCGASLADPLDAECANCGLILAVPQKASVVETSRERRIIDHRWVVLFVLFGVTGVLGLPLLWVSRGFSRSEKWFWSLIVTVYTGVLVLAAGYSCWLAWQGLSELAS